MTDYPLWLQATGGDAAIPYGGSDDRSLIKAMYGQRGLLFDPNGFKLTQRGAGANYSVDIAPGAAVIGGDSVSNQGSFLVVSSGTVNLPTPSAPASGTRVHRVCAEILDKQSAGSAYGWQFHLQEDTGSGTPGIPASALDIGRVYISAGQGSVTNTNMSNVTKWASPFVTGASPVAGEYGLAAGGPIAAVYQTTSQSINHDFWTDLTFQAAERNPLNAWNASLPSRFTCPIAGSYLVNGGFCLGTFTSNTSPTSASHVGYASGARITVASVATPTSGVEAKGSANFSLFTQWAGVISTVDVRPRVVYCNRGDVIRIQGIHNWVDTAGTNVSYDDSRSFMDVTFLG